MRILLVDDEPLARQRLRHLLSSIANTEIVGECGDGTEAVDAIRRLRPDVVLLDIQMRTMDGFALVDTVGQSNMPAIVFVTAHDEHAVRAFDVHAVDYLLKPVTLEGLERAIARAAQRRSHDETDLRDDVRALVETVRRMIGGAPVVSSMQASGARPAPGVQRPDHVSFGDVTVDFRAHTVTRGGMEVALSPRGFSLLAALVQRPGVVIPRTTLLQEIWGYSSDVMSRTVDMHIMELRRKLEADPANPKFILTVRKGGYRFDPDR